MARAFALAGLQRLRDLQEAQAAGKLAAANAKLREGSARAARARAAADAAPVDADSAAALQAVAAARASTRSLLVELDGLVASLDDEAEAVRTEYREARRRAVVLEKLGERHAEGVLREDLAREQAALDELAARGRPAEGTQA